MAQVEDDAPGCDKAKSNLRRDTLSYLYLAIAIVAEVIGTSALKASDGLSRLGPSLVVAAGFATAFLFGQTASLAPADRRLYAIRDVTATVESVDLITASILSKKLAAGLQALVMDVKFGSGAFMTDVDDARGLARSLVLVANSAGLKTSALLTDMNEPLASAAGNAIEIAYIADYLTGRRREPRFHEVTVTLAAEMLTLGGIASDAAVGRAAIEAALSSGQAAEIFSRMVRALGGPGDLLDADRRLDRASIVREVAPERSGVVQEVANREIGLAVVALGGGRTNPQDPVDPAVGFSGLAGIGQRVGASQPLGLVHARTEAAAEAGAAALRQAYRIGDGATAPGPLILERVDT